MNKKLPAIALINGAPHDAQIVLTRIARRTPDERVILLVDEACGLLDFFQTSLSKLPEVEVFRLPCTSRIRVSRPIGWFRLRKSIDTVMRQLDLSGGDELWYIGDFCALSTSGVISQAKKRGVRIIDADRPQYMVERLEPKFLEHIKLLLLRIVLGIPQHIVSIGTGNRHFFLDSDRLGVERIPGEVSPDKLKPFLYMPKSDTKVKRKNLLLFESSSGDKVYEKYAEQMLETVKRLSDAGYNIYVKPHPRLGVSEFIRDFPQVTVVPQAVPGELMDYSGFSVAVAVYSVALVHTAALGIPSFCLELLFKRNNPTTAESDVARLLGNLDLPTGAPLFLPKTWTDFYAHSALKPS